MEAEAGAVPPMAAGAVAGHGARSAGKVFANESWLWPRLGDSRPTFSSAHDCIQQLMDETAADVGLPWARRW
jgi:hypothetical protein